MILQLVAFYSVIQWYRTLVAEYNKRREILEERKRSEQAKESLQKEIIEYGAKLQIEHEHENVEQ